MTIQLRPYQSRAVDAAKEQLRRSSDPIIIDAAPAAGKSFMIAMLADWLGEISGGKRVLCLAPNATLVKQNFQKFLLTGEPASIFSASAGVKSTRHRVVFATPGTVKNSISRFSHNYCAVVVDECFVGGTLVKTPRGPVPINLLRNGDIVCNAVGSGEVVTTFAKAVTELYEVSFSDGRKIRCTGNHPFFTERGWVAAEKLEREIVFRSEDLSCMLDCVRAGEDRSQGKGGLVSAFGGGMGQACYLFEVLRKEIEEPNALREFTEKNEQYACADWAQACDARREWPRANGGAGGAVCHHGRWMGDGVFSPDDEGASEWRVSKPLQNRHSESGTHDSDRGGWWEPLHTGSSSAGPAKDGIVDAIRVESVTRVQLASPETVYNLHVSGHPSYYAGGVLVHNCHEITPTIKSIIEAMRAANPNLRVIGLSGTPFRLGTGYIYAQCPDGSFHGTDKTRDPYFARCVYQVSAREMLEEGFITPMEIGAINTGAYDVSGLELLPNGHWNADGVEKAFVGHGRKTAAIVADVVAQAQGRHGGVMLFAATVQHAHEILASLPPDNAALVTGDVSILRGKEVSDKIAVDAYREGKVRYIVSVGKLTTGFDVSHTSIIATLRKTESDSLLQQILGRAWRLDPNKPTSLWLDYAGNHEAHFPDGDIYKPTISAKGAPVKGEGIEVECPDCSYINTFSVHQERTDYQFDRHGYALDVFGELIEPPLPVHHGRRCMGLISHEQRCNYRWAGKDCPTCGEVNDIAARYCYICKAEIVDPNDRLIADFKALKKDPTIPQTDEVVSMAIKESISQRGNRTMRVDWVTPYRQFTSWLQPEGNHPRARKEWIAFNEATNGGENQPATISYVQDPETRFYRIICFNRDADALEMAA